MADYKSFEIKILPLVLKIKESISIETFQHKQKLLTMALGNS